MSAFRLIPREGKFYGDFLTLADAIRSGARLLEDMLRSDPPVYAKAGEIKEIEHQCDHLAHEIIQRLHRTFVTPIDREDIHELTGALDDVMDAIDSVAALIGLYRIEHIRYGARELTRIISAQTDQIRLGIEVLETRRGVADRTVEINRLEHEADRVHQEALRKLFEDERDPINIIKWKEILDFLEDATDRCEDVANLLEGVVVKLG